MLRVTEVLVYAGRAVFLVLSRFASGLYLSNYCLGLRSLLRGNSVELVVGSCNLLLNGMVQFCFVSSRVSSLRYYLYRDMAEFYAQLSLPLRLNRQHQSTVG